jgi:hypothetical protein
MDRSPLILVRGVAVCLEVKMKTAVAIPFAVILIAACTSTQMTSSHKYPPVSVDSVEIFYQEPRRPYEVIALINRRSGVEHPASGDVSGLREEAAHLGADALIITEAHGMTVFSYAEASGKAIKWTR